MHDGVQFSIVNYFHLWDLSSCKIKQILMLYGEISPGAGFGILNRSHLAARLQAHYWVSHGAIFIMPKSKRFCLGCPMGTERTFQDYGALNWSTTCPLHATCVPKKRKEKKKWKRKKRKWAMQPAHSFNLLTYFQRTHDNWFYQVSKQQQYDLWRYTNQTSVGINTSGISDRKSLPLKGTSNQIPKKKSLPHKSSAAPLQAKRQFAVNSTTFTKKSCIAITCRKLVTGNLLVCFVLPRWRLPENSQKVIQPLHRNHQKSAQMVTKEIPKKQGIRKG